MTQKLSQIWFLTRNSLEIGDSKWLGTGILTYFIIAIAGIVIYQFWRKREFYELAAKIPGPAPTPIFGNALEFLSLDHSKLLDYLENLMTKYNGFARIWLGNMLFVHISKPEDLEIAMTSSKLIEKNVMYSFFDDILGQGLLNSSGDVWKKHRRVIAPTFHSSILKHFVQIFEKQSKILVELLKEKADGKTFDAFPYIRNCSLDFITETALETHADAQLNPLAATRAAERTNEGKEYLRLKKEVIESIKPLLEDKKKELADEERKEKENLEIAITKERKSFFRQLVNLNQDPEKFNDKELRDEVLTIIITGYETTAATISFVLVMLGIHQEVQDKVYEEVAVFEDYLKGKEIEAEDLTRFEYMDRVIKETLRLYPVGPIICRKSTANVPFTTFTIPKGASVAMVLLKTHRDPAHWDDPDSFNPDNFLPEKVEKRHPYAFLPFSAGARNCIGKNYAFLSMRVMLYYILSKYRVLCDLKLEDVKIKSEVTLKMCEGFNIKLVPRVNYN